MTSKLNRVCDILFSAEGETVLNVKFFPGDNRSVTAEQLADQLDRAEAQLRAGTAVRSKHLDAGLTRNRLQA